ncbi:M56 family metallopeptidase [Cesiribacter sp. SM1]|uniref:M56 family metallopeptidase n=1 Tax=Cesiribacter sp. SM1 TaxID=2861196 RepID=UPI001CD408C8|nr:M56 family metallopeptidase [Cesiribacter sp. SM1]
MPSAIVYIIQLNTALVLFYLLYRLVFRPLTFYRLNRGLLLFGLLFSIIYPLIDINLLFSRPLELNGAYKVVLPVLQYEQVQQQASSFDYWYWLQFLFWSVTALMVLRLLLRFTSLYRLHRQAQPASHAGYHFRCVEGAVNPFSFWSTIYVNPGYHEPQELLAILKHEQVHVRELHSLDILLAELLLLFCWFNPAMWLTKKVISENLEFITDQQLLQGNIDSRFYQYSLLKISKLPEASSLVNNFNFLTIKTRIAMMNKKRSARVHAFKYALVIPLMCGLITACSVPDHEEELILADEPGSRQESTLPEVSYYYVDGKEWSKENVSTLDPGEIESVEVFKGENATAVFGEEAASGVVVINTRKNSNTEAARAMTVKIRQASGDAEADTESMADKLLIIDGREVTESELNRLSPDMISQMEVLKGEQALQKWGDKARGGAIIITTKQKN